MHRARVFFRNTYYLNRKWNVTVEDMHPRWNKRARGGRNFIRIHFWELIIFMANAIQILNKYHQITVKIPIITARSRRTSSDSFLRTSLYLRQHVNMWLDMTVTGDLNHVTSSSPRDQWCHRPSHFLCHCWRLNLALRRFVGETPASFQLLSGDSCWRIGLFIAGRGSHRHWAVNRE